ncbi:serine/threonine-protein kinase STY13-like [Neltuma alba]|uniref:serine/threonine-protein kinase STY13-like n=1 Tax=Neltuma alba TaxID=207710 RepID=UPI0010A2AAEC|nr:serine/threonine-protein kinase STY13-like [Prosopis alba]
MSTNFRDSPEIMQSLTSPRLSRQSSKASSKHKNLAEAASPVHSGCCRGFGNVKTTGPTLSTLQYQQQLNHSKRLEGKVADLEKEVQRQTELRVMYRKRMERTQDYLRYCLQIAQENGILDLITHSKADLQQSPLSLHTVNSTASPQIRSPVRRRQHHPDLAAIIDQAKIHGWYIDPLEIQMEEKIGQGTTAEIYRATWRGYDVAVKCLSAEFFRTNAHGVVFFAQEVDTLSRQRHRFVLQLMGACLDPPHHAWMVTEHVRTTLKDWLHGPGKRRRDRQVPLPSLKDRVMRALEIAQAMQYLHEQKPKVIHRDLKPSNIFLDDALHVRIADFGHARFLADQEMALTGETGTYVYMAPEVIRCEPYNEKCDVYSFGVILNELLTGNYPYIETDYSPTKIAVEVVEGKLRPMVAEDREGEVEELVQVIRLCWDGNPTMRPSFATIATALKAYIKEASFKWLIS